MLEHPRHDELAGLVFGDLPDDQARKVAQHVEQCPQCEETVRELETSPDDVIRLLRHPAVEHPFELESGCRRLVEVVEAIGCDPSFTGASRQAAGEQEDLGTIRDYRLLAKLGQGGMGTVYKALHGKLEKVVALKVLPAERMKHAHAVERFEQEMRAVGRLTHGNWAHPRTCCRGSCRGRRRFLVSNAGRWKPSCLAARLTRLRTVPTDGRSLVAPTLATCASMTPRR